MFILHLQWRPIVKTQAIFDISTWLCPLSFNPPFYLISSPFTQMRPIKKSPYEMQAPIYTAHSPLVYAVSSSLAPIACLQLCGWGRVSASSPTEFSHPPSFAAEAGSWAFAAHVVEAYAPSARENAMQSDCCGKRREIHWMRHWQWSEWGGRVWLFGPALCLIWVLPWECQWQ
jgi:hypothetical protein